MKELRLMGGLHIVDDGKVSVKFKKLVPAAVAPRIMKLGDAGADLTAVSVNDNDMYIEYGTGLSVEIPPSYVGYIFPRSSCSNYHLSLANAVGVIDSNYRGEIKFRFKKTLSYPSIEPVVYNVGERIGQLIVMPIPEVTFEEAEELSDSNRGTGGYGSSGK